LRQFYRARRGAGGAKNWPPAKRIAFIPNGVPMSQRVAQGSQENARRLVFVGRLVYQKGLDLLFPCLSWLKSMGLHFQLTVVGDGEMRSDLEKWRLH